MSRMRTFISLGLVAAAWAAPLQIDVSDKSGRRFDGLGGLSGGGATSRLLPDYPEPQRSEVLDFLFKPQFGASLQMLKVEIGGDSQSTDGTESSHMHSADDLDYKRGYEWWLLSEAKKRNPDIKTYGLPWAFPGWVGGPEQSGSPFTHPNLTSTYILKWLEGARDVYGVDIDYIGIWNERASDSQYAQTLRKTLDDSGFKNTRLVAKDGGKDICDSMAKDKAYADAIDIVGLHYPTDYTDYSVCQSLGKPIWASEESSSYDDLNGAACWGRVVTSHYVLNGMTASIMWNLVGSYYHGTNWYASSLLTAVQPWSGFYEKDMPVVWATAHITQFTAPGWRYLGNGSGTGELPKGGFYASLVDGDDYTLNVVKISRDHASCTRPKLPDFDVADEVVTFQFDTSKGGVPSKPLFVWYSNFEAEHTVLFENQGKIEVGKDGTFSLNVTVGSMFTVSTIDTAKKGSFSSQAKDTPDFPLPYSDDFDGYDDSTEAKYWADQIGAFEVHNASAAGASGERVMRQMVPELPIGWSDHGSNGPMTLIGMREWQDLKTSVRFAIPDSAPGNLSACIGNRVDQMWNFGTVFCVSPDGKWTLARGGPKLGGTYVPSRIFAQGTLKSAPAKGKWNIIELTTLKDKATASLNGETVVQDATVDDTDTGFTAIGMGDWASVEFDDFKVAVAEAAEEVPARIRQSFAVGAPVEARDCARNTDADPAQAFSLRANSWWLVHPASGLCVEAASADSGAKLALAVCKFGQKTQQFRNDYTRIRNTLSSVTLGAYVPGASDDTTLTLVGTAPNAPVELSSSNPAKGGWNKWSYFPNSKQLRNQYVSTDSGYPQCLTVVS